MTPREIIAEAWSITRRERRLWRWGMTFSLLETLLNLKLLSYQAYFFWEFSRGRPAGFFDVEIVLYHSIPFWLFLTIVITFTLMVTAELFVPHMAQGAIIGLAAKAYRGEPLKGGTLLAIYNFLPILAIHELFVLSSLATSVTVTSLVLRYVNGSIKTGIIIGIFVMWFISNILKFFGSFAEEAVVLRRTSIFEGLSQSFKLIISYLSHIMFLLVLLFVISIRILVNMVTILLIPAVVIGLGMLLALFLSKTLSILIAVLIGIGLIVLASYFFAYLHVFNQTVWTIAYIELTKQKDLHVILD